MEILSTVERALAQATKRKGGLSADEEGKYLRPNEIQPDRIDSLASKVEP